MNTSFRKMSEDQLRRDLRLRLEGCSTGEDSEDEPPNANPLLPFNPLKSDTRTHVILELYETERSYVESLQTLVTKYLEPLKSVENAGLLDAEQVDEIFYQIPTLCTYHESFLDELKTRLDHWDTKQKVGEVLLDMVRPVPAMPGREFGALLEFSNPAVIESYTNYVNNWQRAREICKTAEQSKPAFANFLEAMAREYGKLPLDSLLIKPIQKFPKYKLLLQRLIQHTDSSHPDHSVLLAAQRQIHEQLLKLNCKEREAFELEQLREIESLIEGLIELVTTDRQYIRYDLVNMTAERSRKERAIFLFSDLLLITRIKRRIFRRPPAGQKNQLVRSLKANKYKLLMKITLDDLEIMRSKDENIRQIMLETDNRTEDISILNQFNELAAISDSQLSCLDLTINSINGIENVSIVFNNPEKRASWEEALTEAKYKLAISADTRPCPELVATVPIRKTRAGLQFTCAASTLGESGKHVWVCSSDGYVGQVCVLSLQPEPTVTPCNGVCNARILCIASVPGINTCSSPVTVVNEPVKADLKEDSTTIQFDSASFDEVEARSEVEETDLGNEASSTKKSAETVRIDSDDADLQSTMWLGTEDSCIHVYNSSDNIRIKKNKVRLQHGSSILCIIYVENRVFVSLANGDIIIYERDSIGNWNVNSPTTITIGTTTMPVFRMLPNSGKLWCACGNTIKVINTSNLGQELNFTVNNDNKIPITCMVLSGNGVWIAQQNSAIIKCYHATSIEYLSEVNVAPAVTKMLTSCGDIFKQHKAAFLRVSSLLACKDLLWIGTSAGVLLTMPWPHITPTTAKLTCLPNVLGVPHGHTGHVRFLTNVEWTGIQEQQSKRHSYKGKPEERNPNQILVISGGDGYEDFRSSNSSEVAGREDSTNHLLLWNILCPLH